MKRGDPVPPREPNLRVEQFSGNGPFKLGNGEMDFLFFTAAGWRGTGEDPRWLDEVQSTERRGQSRSREGRNRRPEKKGRGTEGRGGGGFETCEDGRGGPKAMIRGECHYKMEIRKVWRINRFGWGLAPPGVAGIGDRVDMFLRWVLSTYARIK